MKILRRTKWPFLFIILLALAVVAPSRALAQQPDVIGDYSVHVTPQDDGTLVIQYNFSNYCATTDFPSDKPYLQVGVPNRNFDLVDWGPRSAPNGQTPVWVTSAEPLQGINSQVQLDFNKQPLAGDCWDLNFTINQKSMAYAQGSDEVSYQFTPGWFDFARINALTITWDIPGDHSLVHKTDPAPTPSANQEVWKDTDLAPNDKFTVTITYAKSAFPNLASVAPAPPPPPSPSTPSTSSGGSDTTWFVCLIILLIFAVIFLQRIFRNYGWDGGYGGGLGRGFIGGAIGGGFGGGGGDGSGHIRSGGGGGGFAGRGSSCACASCACACACAGGGRAGCTRKGFDISRLLRTRARPAV